MQTLSEVQPILKLSDKQTEAWHYLTDQTTTEIYYGGAAGGGKSWLGCLWKIHNRIKYPKSRGLIGRANISALEQSTLITYFKVADLMGYKLGIHFTYNSQKHVINWINGSQEILKDLFQYPGDPDFISLGSTEYTDAFIDEGTEITQRAAGIVSTRLRWMVNEFRLVPKLLITCNPRPGWIKDTIIQHPKTKEPIILEPYQKYVRALVTDNPDKSFVDLYRQQLERTTSDYDRERLLYGNWDAEPSNDSPFAHQWDDNYHIGHHALHDPLKRIIISVDFNLTPFAVTFSHHWHDAQGWHDWTFDEAEIQKGSIPAMIDLIRERYGKYLHSAYLTGDHMGKRGDISQRDNSSNYLQLMKGLGLAPTQLRVLANPTHENSKADTNKVLWLAKQDGKGVEFKVHPSCKGTIRDFRSVQWDDLKNEIKKRDRSQVEQRADLIDTQRYKINVFWRGVVGKM